jgi:glyoxylase-like metal-dependent hydrolase (beta-lactamase superfamily II)
VSDWSTPPATDEVEVCLFGPGKGESVLVHLCNDNWLVVDSCLDADQRPAALSYLDAIGVSPQSIQLIVATHWHDDHIGGLAEIVSRVPLARFVCSQALKTPEFLKLVAAADWKPEIHATSGVHEFAKVLDAMRLTGRSGPEWAIESRTLLTGSAPDRVVMALSPSDESVTEAWMEVGQLLRQQEQGRLAVPRPSRNPGAVVLHVRVGDTTMLLCSDLAGC